MPLVLTTGRKRIDITNPDGSKEWYEIRTELTWAQLQECAPSNALTMRTNNMLSRNASSEDKMDVGINVIEARLKKLSVFIIAWSHPQPITDAMLLALDNKTVKNHLLPPIDEIIKTQAEDIVTSETPLVENSIT